MVEKSYRHSRIRIWCFCRQALSYKNNKMQQLASVYVILLEASLLLFAIREEQSVELRFNMYNVARNNSRVGGGNGGGLFGASRYQYQAMPQGYENAQAGSLISKVMGLLASSFLFAFIGALVGFAIGLTTGGYLVVVIGGFVTLIILSFAINTPGLNLFLLYLFTFLEGLGLSRILGLYLGAGYARAPIPKKGE